MKKIKGGVDMRMNKLNKKLEELNKRLNRLDDKMKEPLT